MVDARDKLAQMAKKTDARAKLLKLRQMRKVSSIIYKCRKISTSPFF